MSFLPSLSQIKLKSTPPLQFQLHPTHTMSSSSLVMPPLPPPAVHSLMVPTTGTSPTSPISLVGSPIVSPPPQQQQHASPLQPASTSRFAAIRASSLGHFLQRKRKHTREAVQARIDEIGQYTQSLGVSFDTEALSIDGKSWDWWMDQDMRRITKRVRTEWGDTRYQQTKRLCATLRKLDKLINGRPLATKTPTKNNTTSIIAPVPTPLSNLPASLRIRFHRVCLQWWKRRCREQQGEGIDCPEQWRNNRCFATEESIQDIPSRYRITYCSNNSGGSSSGTTRDVWFVFDVRILSRNAIVKNPYTNKPFTDSFIAFYKKRANHLKHLGYSLATEWDEPEPSPKSVKQLMTEVNHRLPELETSLIEGLTDQELAEWYLQCYFMMTDRLGLSSASIREMLTGTIFRYYSTITQSDEWRNHRDRRRNCWRNHLTSLELRYEVWTTMHKMLESSQTLLKNYVVMALTLCSTTIQSHESDYIRSLFWAANGSRLFDI